MATGLQSKFSWAGVAAAGIGGLTGKYISAPGLRIGANALANAATRSLIDGSDFGDNLIAALPDVMSQVIGTAVAGRIAGNGGSAGTTGDRERRGGVLSAVGDFLGFDGEFGYDGVNGPTGAGRNLSLAGLGGAIGDFVGLDGQFGQQGMAGRNLSLAGLGDAVENVIAPPRAVATPQQEGPTLHGPLRDAVSRPGQDAALWTDTKVPFFGDDSPYMTRSRRYREIQAELEARGFEDSYYFDAVGAMTENIASSDILPLGRYLSGLDEDVARYANGLSQGIADNNERQFQRVLDGDITERGRALDVRLVADEQRFIQGRLDALEQSNPDLFRRFTTQIDRNANMTGWIDGVNFVTDPHINMAADRARATIGGPIRFANETHRNIMGQTMAQVMREYRTRQEAIRNYAPPPGPHQ